MRASLIPWLLPALAAWSCLGGGDDFESDAEDLAMRCTAQVSGIGTVRVEEDYLPRVLSCENGGAPIEALRALAVAARSYLYYRLEETGSINDGVSDQVYSCGRPPGPNEIQAVRDTAGLVLRYDDMQVVGFHVAGAEQEPPCLGGERGPYGYTETRWVTHNAGRYGDDVFSSPIGWPGSQNRGCFSQNGSSCLASAGKHWEEILHYYYGEDVAIVPTTGSCGSTVPASQAPTPAPFSPTPSPTPVPDSTQRPATSTGSCQSDPLEPNDRSRSASSFYSGNLSICSGDVDWFRATTDTGRLHVDLRFAHADGNLNLEVFSTRRPYPYLSGAYSRDDDEVLDLTVEPGTYWLRVYAANGAQNPRYTISW